MSLGSHEVPADSGRASAHLGLLLSMFFWGAMTPALYVLLLTWDAWTLSALRFAVAVPLLLLVLWAREGWRAMALPAAPWRLAVLGLVGITGLSICYTLGIAYSDPITAVVVQSGGPVIAVIVARLCYRVAVPRGIGLSLVLTSIGALLTLLPKLHAASGPGFRGGELLLVGGSICWAWYSLACQRWLQGVSQLRVTTHTIITGAIGLWLAYLAAVALGAASFPMPGGSPQAILVLVGSVAGSTCLGVLLWHYGVSRLGVPVAALYLNLQPVFAMLVTLALGIWPSSEQVAGGVLVILGVMQFRLRQSARLPRARLPRARSSKSPSPEALAPPPPGAAGSMRLATPAQEGSSAMPSRADHDRAVRFIAAQRFPFPGQTDWPPDNLTLTNESERRRGVESPEGIHYPDIVIVSRAGTVREVAEVETEVGEAQARIWAWSSAAADNGTKTGVKHFFVYVPPGLEMDAIELLKRHGISYAGVRTWSVEGERIRIVPVITTGDPKDHQESVSA